MTLDSRLTGWKTIVHPDVFAWRESCFPLITAWGSLDYLSIKHGHFG